MAITGEYVRHKRVTCSDVADVAPYAQEHIEHTEHDQQTRQAATGKERRIDADVVAAVGADDVVRGMIRNSE